MTAGPWISPALVIVPVPLVTQWPPSLYVLQEKSQKPTAALNPLPLPHSSISLLLEPADMPCALWLRFGKALLVNTADLASSGKPFSVIFPRRGWHPFLRAAGMAVNFRSKIDCREMLAREHRVRRGGVNSETYVWYSFVTVINSTFDTWTLSCTYSWTLSNDNGQMIHLMLKNC